MKKLLVILAVSLMLAVGISVQASADVLRYDFDNLDGISFYRADGECEDGILVFQPNTPTSAGKFDHGIFLDDLGFDASEYDTFKIRMKRDRLENVDPDASRPEWLQVYFATETEATFNDARGVSLNLKSTFGEEKLSDWFVAEIKLSSNALWKGTIPRMRIDTTDNNGVYYIDYIEFSNSGAAKPEVKEEPKEEVKPVVKETFDSDVLRYDFDNLDGVSFYRADGELDNGILVMIPNTPTAAGKFDHGIYLEELNFDASKYDTFKIRMKRDKVDNLDTSLARTEWLQVYFAMDGETNFIADRGVSVNLKTIVGEAKLSDWFEVEVKLTDNALWKGNVTRMRIDTTDNNGIYYVDYFELSNKSSGSAKVEEKPVVKEEPKTEEKPVVKEEPKVTEISFEKVNTYNGNFSDVADTAWYAENVKKAFELGFMNGKSEGKFDPNGNVTVAEAITMASRVNAICYGREIKSGSSAGEFRLDFDNLDGLTEYHAYAESKDGVLVLTADEPNKNGVYDPGVILDKLDFKARDYDKLVVRMKRDVLPNVDPNKARNERLQVYFQTNNELSFSGDRVIYFNLKNLGGEDVLTNWFEIEIPLSTHELWKDTITKIRFDTTDNNGIYYIDYLSFKKDAENKNQKWYHMYVDYALENNIIEKGDYAEEEYTRNATRAELVWLLAAALPEEYFAPINNVTAIPDMDKNDYYADIVLMLYKAGVVLGDANGNFNAQSDIKRSETAAIINRVALPENRVKGEIKADWKGMYYSNDIEFDDPEKVSDYIMGSTFLEIKDGHLIAVAEERPDNMPPKFDPKFGLLGTNIKADEYTTIKIRMKMDLEGEISNMKGEFYFIPEGFDNFTEENSLKPRPDFDSNYYVDAAGWRVYTFYLGICEAWKGNIKAIRIDPTNNNGTFTIDYVRFIRDESTMIVSDEELAANYTSRTLLADTDFEKGFKVFTSGNRDTKKGKSNFEGNWTYGGSSAEPEWQLGAWWTSVDLLANRDETKGEYVLADNKGISYIEVKPEEGSVILRQDTQKVYNGASHVSGDMWPHLLIEQIYYDEDWDKVPEDRKATLDLDADKVYLEMDVRINDYKDLNPASAADDKKVVQYNVYLYVCVKDFDDYRTYFGVNPFDNRGLKKNTDFWKDGYSVYMIYTVPTAEIFGGAENTFLNDDGSFDIGEWKNIRYDITPHLEDLAKKLTDANTLGRAVTRDDFWLSGLNVGFEIWGNYQCEVEIKNLDVICYDKK